MKRTVIGDPLHVVEFVESEPQDCRSGAGQGLDDAASLGVAPRHRHEERHVAEAECPALRVGGADHGVHELGAQDLSAAPPLNVARGHEVGVW